MLKVLDEPERIGLRESMKKYPGCYCVILLDDIADEEGNLVAISESSESYLELAEYIKEINGPFGLMGGYDEVIGGINIVH